MGARGGREAMLACHDCGNAVTTPIAYQCPRCAGPVVVQPGPVADPSWMRADPSGRGIWRYRRALPPTQATVSLGEGATPVVALPERVTGRPGLLAKLELLNPTLSFKDRAMALGTSLALDQEAAGLALASTGNAAVSAAAYAAAANLPCQIVCAASAGTSDNIAIAHALGAGVTAVEGDYSSAHAHAVAMEDRAWLNVTTTYRNPFLVEAHRTVAYELAEALGGRPVDAVVVPVGAGPLLRGIFEGFRDLVAIGAAGTTPRMVGVQGVGCSPLVHAWGGPSPASWLARLEGWGPAGPTLAAAIADPLRGYEREGVLTLEAVADSGGDLVGVDDEAIRRALRSLGKAGYIVEAAAAAALAAVPQLEGRGVIAEGDTVVLVLTGHGMKEAGALRAMGAAEAPSAEEEGVP